MTDRLRASLAIAIIHGVALLLLFGRWWPTFNDLGPAVWLSTLPAAAIIAAVSTVRESARLEAEARPVTETSPRSRFTIVLLHWGADVLTLAFIPTCAVVILSYSAVGLFGFGYLDWGYPLYSLLFAVTVVLLGKVLARVFVGRLLAPLVAVIIAVFSWMYTIVTGAHSPTWMVFDPAALVIVACLAALLFGGLLLVQITRGRQTVTVASITIAIFVLFVFFGGSIHVYNTPRTPTADPVCTPVGEDEICVWPEDEPLLPGLAEQLRRAQALETAADIERPALVFAEPGYDRASDGPNRATVSPGEGEASLRSAQGFLEPALETHTGHPSCVGVNSAGDEFDRHFQVADLMTAYVMGDMTDDSWATSNPEMDAWRLQLGEALAEWSEDDRVRWLGEQLANYNENCEFSGEIAP